MQILHVERGDDTTRTHTLQENKANTVKVKVNRFHYPCYHTCDEN